MTSWLFPWTFIGVAAVLDIAGLFYLWRRRNSEVGTSHRADLARALRIPLAERRRNERRGTGKAAAV